MENLTFDTMLDKLRGNENFSFQRWGDGEFQCLLGYDGANCDGTQYTPELGLSLAAVLLADQTGHYGIQPKCLADMGEKIHEWIADNNCDAKWGNADILHDASIEGRIGEFVKALKGRKVIFVGNHRLQPIADSLQAPRVTVPTSHVWKWYRQVYGDLLDHISKDCVILYSMSIPTNILINQISAEYGESVTQISCGSMWEPYAGYRIRRYHQKIIDREFV